MAIFGIYYLAMALSALIIEYLFVIFRMLPVERNKELIVVSIHWNYTSFLNIIFGIIGVVLLMRFIKTNGLKMLKMM